MGRPAPRRAPVDPDEDEIARTIDRLSQDIDEGTRQRAFNSGGGDSFHDEGSSDVQDDLMERAYYANQRSSDEL